VATTPDPHARELDRRTAAIDTSIPHPARRYDYWLGGKDNFAADRQSGDRGAAAYPAIRTTVIENRALMHRIARALTLEYGIRQFLDVGTGIPTRPNLHEVVQSIAPEARVVYVDNDPIVLAHARALLTSTARGKTAYVDADLRRPDDILTDADMLRTLDLAQPMAVTLMAVLHFLPRTAEPREVTRRLLAAAAPGSFLAISHATLDLVPEHVRRAILEAGPGMGIDMTYASREEFGTYFDDLELVPPGIVPIAEWRPDDPDEVTAPENASMWIGVARKP
jgi:hypothetical protein